MENNLKGESDRSREPGKQKESSTSSYGIREMVKALYPSDRELAAKFVVESQEAYNQAYKEEMQTKTHDYGEKGEKVQNIIDGECIGSHPSLSSLSGLGLLDGLLSLTPVERESLINRSRSESDTRQEHHQD